MNIEQQTRPERALLELAERVVQAGSAYRVEEFPEIYAPDLRIVMIPPTGAPTVFDYEANATFFRARRDAGEPPMSTERAVRAVECFGDEGIVVLDRHASFTGVPQQVTFTLWARRTADGWRITREVAVIR